MRYARRKRFYAPCLQIARNCGLERPYDATLRLESGSSPIAASYQFWPKMPGHSQPLSESGRGSGDIPCRHAGNVSGVIRVLQVLLIHVIRYRIRTRLIITRNRSSLVVITYKFNCCCSSPPWPLRSRSWQMMYQVYTSLSRLGALPGRRSLARSGLLTISLVTLMIVVYVYMYSDGSPVVISAHGQAERVLKSGNTACSHDESRRYLQELVSISTS